MIRPFFKFIFIFQVKDFKSEQRIMEQQRKIKLTASQAEINRLKRVYELKNQEINRVSFALITSIIK